MQDLAKTVSTSKFYPALCGTTSQVNGTVDSGVTLLLRAIVEVMLLLLVMAGDVEINPGPKGNCLKKGSIMPHK